jgi:capsular exopolysaccharide synthesis family protein
MHGNLPPLLETRRPGPTAQPAESDANEVAQLLRQIWRRKALIVLVTLAGTLSVAAAVMQLPATYRAEAVLLFQPAAATPDPTRAGEPAERVGDRRHLASEIERIRSRALLSQVVREARLLYDPAFNPVLDRRPGVLERLGLRAPPPAEALRLSRQREATLAGLRARLQVRPVGQALALSIAVEAPDAAAAARVANAVADVYLTRTETRVQAQRQAATAWLDRRVAELRRRVQAAEAAVADFRIESGLAERGPDSAAAQDRVSALNRALAEAQVEAASARARLQQVSAVTGGGGDGPDGEAAPRPGSLGAAAGGADARDPGAASRGASGAGASGAGPSGAGASGVGGDGIGAGALNAGSLGLGGLGLGGLGSGGLGSGSLGSGSLAQVLQSQLIRGLRQQEAELRGRRAQLATRYGPRHPKLRAANAELLDVRLELDDALAQAVQGLRREAAMAGKREAALQAELQDVRGDQGALSRAQVRLAQLEREAAAERALFDTFLARLKETRIAADTPGGGAELITRAHPPGAPAAPNRPLLAGFGALAAFALALALAGLREVLDRGVREPEQLERVTGLRVLGSVPHAGRRPVRQVLARPTGALAESLRGLHTALLLGDVDRPPRTLLVTSALPGEGKTTLACALARVLAQAGSRVLLIDADLRYPAVAAQLRLPARPGLGELLARQCAAEAALVADPAPGLDGRLTVLPAGRAGDPGSLPDSQSLGALLDLWESVYDLIVIDAPPALAVADARRLAARIDKTVLAVRWSATPRPSVQRAAAQLRDAGADFAGAVLTQVNARQHARDASGYGAGLGRRRRYYAGA